MVFLAIPAGNARAVTDYGSNNSPKVLNVPAPEFYGAHTNTAGSIIIITFTRDMADPSGNQANFIYRINGEGAPQNFSVAALAFGNPQYIELTCAGVAIAAGNQVTVSYIPGTVQDTGGGLLAGFTDAYVENKVLPHISLGMTYKSIIADGASKTDLTAELFDTDDEYADDGTVVLFSTDHGSVGSVTPTSGGVATAVLTSQASSDEMIVAKVTATALGVHESRPVYFIPDGKPAITACLGRNVYGSVPVDLWFGSATVDLWLGSAIFDAVGEHFFAAGLYSENPGSTPTFHASDIYFDIYLDHVAGINSLTLTSCDPGFLPAGDALTIFFWDGSTWKPASNQTWAKGCMTVVITKATSPSLSDLSGLPFTFGFASPPTIASVNPASGLWGQTLPVIITGTNLGEATAISFGTGITSRFTVNNATQITATIGIADGAAPGARNVSVTTLGGTATLAGGFTVVQRNQSIGTGSHSSTLSVVAPTAATPPITNPIIQTQSASLSARSVTPGTPVIVTADITNKSTVNGSKKVTLYINGEVETTQGVTVNSGGSTKLTFNVSRSEPGEYSVYVDGIPAGSFKVELFRESDGILIFSVVLVGLAFLIGMVMLWRRQRAV
jgi:hypothetical protein